MEIPANLDWLRGHAAGRRWLAGLPGQLATCADHWELRLGRPYEGSYVSLVVPAHRRDGSTVVLKVQYPDRESDHEAAALRHWDGDGVARLVDDHPPARALLLEQCVPGTPLAALGQDGALTVLIGLLPRLWKPAAGPFTPVAREARRWADALPRRWEAAGRPCARRLVDAAVARLDELPASQGVQVLVHQDLHEGNVLRAGREPWLVIDPKPLVGERELSAAPLVHSYGLGHSRDHVHHRLDRLSAELDLDRQRVRDWSIAHAMVWAFQDEAGMTRHLETATWLLPPPALQGRGVSG